MTREDFLKFAETYGGNISRWPEEVGAEAQSFLDADSEYANQILQDAGELDNALERARVAPGTDMLKARILTAARVAGATPQVASSSKPQGLRYRAVAALVAGAFVLGFTGANYLNSDINYEDVTMVSADSEWQDLADDYGMDELYAWVGQDTLP